MARNLSQSNMQLWRQVPALEGKRVLDVSCGAGTSTGELVRLGLKVVCTNYDAERNPAIPEQAEFVGGVDLNEAWPFEDESFDGVHIQEVIEHLQNATHAVREISRILKPGGTLVLSTPNILNLHSRFHFLFTGFYEGRRHPIGYSKGLGDAGNLYMTNLPQLHYLMAQCGLSIRALATHRVIWPSCALLPLAPLVALFTYLATFRPRPSIMMNRAQRQGAPPDRLAELARKQKRVNARVRRLMLSRHALLSRNLLVRAEKTGADPFDA